MANEFDQFVESQEAMVASSASMAFGIDQLKQDLVAKGWNESEAEMAAIQLFNTLLLSGSLK